MTTTWDRVRLLAYRYGIGLIDEVCSVSGLMLDFLFRKNSPSGIEVELVLNENGPTLTLETQDGQNWTVSRTWGSMTPFDTTSTWKEVIPENEGDLPDELLPAYPTELEYGLLAATPEGVIDTENAFLLLEVWFDAFQKDEELRLAMTQQLRRQLLDTREEDDPSSTPPPQTLN